MSTVYHGEGRKTILFALHSIAVFTVGLPISARGEREFATFTAAPTDATSTVL